MINQAVEIPSCAWAETQPLMFKYVAATQPTSAIPVLLLNISQALTCFESPRTRDFTMQEKEGETKRYVTN